MSDLTDAFNSALERGYTMRRYPGGERAMVHRWNYKKIRGAKPLKYRLVESIYRNNALLQSLMRRQTP